MSIIVIKFVVVAPKPKKHLKGGRRRFGSSVASPRSACGYSSSNNSNNNFKDSVLQYRQIQTAQKQSCISKLIVIYTHSPLYLNWCPVAPWPFLSRDPPPPLQPSTAPHSFPVDFPYLRQNLICHQQGSDISANTRIWEVPELKRQRRDCYSVLK